MRTLFHFLHFGLIGAGIGSVITTLSLLAMGADGASLPEIALWMITSFLIGIYTTLMYHEKLSLLAATAIHFVLTFGTVLGSCLLLSYGDGLGLTLRNMLPTFLVIYVVVYLIIYFTSKSNEKQINEALSKH